MDQEVCRALATKALNAVLGNPWTILSSENDEPAEDELPPSDPPEESESDSESGQETPISQMPALTSLLGAANNMDTSRASVLKTRSRQSLRGSSVPPQDSPDDVDVRAEHPTSNDTPFTPRKEKRILQQRWQTQRLQTRVQNRAEKVSATEKEKEAAAKKADLEAQAKMLRHFRQFLADMKANDISLADFLDHVFNPETKLSSDWRWRGFFAHQNTVARIFGYWTTSKYNLSTHTFLHNWATDCVSKAASTESRAITRSGILKKTKKIVNEQFFLDFSLTNLAHTIRGMAPTVFKVFDSFSTTTRRLRKGTQKFLEKKELMKGAVALTLLRGASQSNNYAQSVNGIYLAATSAQRQHFPVLGIYGFSIGYTNIVSSLSRTAQAVATAEKTSHEKVAVDSAGDLNGVDDAPGVPAAVFKKKRKKSKNKPKQVRGAGLLSVLRDACMATVRTLAKSRLAGLTYDNINLMNQIAEQVLGRKSAQENGTCATLFPLHNAKLEHLQTADLDTSILNAPPLTLDDIILDETDSEFLTKNMVHTILRIVVVHGGKGFGKWQKEFDASQPVSTDIIDVHKTPLHPLPTMEIDESSITGNVEVIEEIMRVLGFKADDPECGKYVQILGGDQLTIARQRSILNVRLGHESGPNAWRHIVLMPGLFHAKIADCHGVLETHFGKPAAGARSPGSLGFHNTVLDRLPITLTSLPPFRTCRDLIMVSLYARVLHCLLLVSGHDSLEQCAASIDTWDTLVNHAEKIYATYTDTERVQELRERRIPGERKRDAEAKAAKKGEKTTEPSKANLPHIRKGDMVFENTVLFLRDALLTREFADAIKTGDSGRIVIILRLWAFSYCGNGRTKYAHEMLHVLHNLICVWTKELRYIVLQNWLTNPQGKRLTFVEIDLKIYKADGAGHSRDWLALVSPCVDILRQLATRMNVELGAQQGSKHGTPDLTKDIATLMASLDEHEVYVEKEGRVLDDDEKAVPDVISGGIAALTHEFNHQFEILRERRRLTPVADLLSLVNSPSIPHLMSAADIDLPAANASAESDDESESLPDTEFPADSDEDEDEDDRELEKEDFFAESPTLTRLEEGDVELDMDAIYLDEEYEEDSESDSDDDKDEDA
ncbi:hypothetical protein K438DRAFT_1777780 [Mycena galopus ATCC 62051]|nr:hypothetical protein K438DRAFT_1777780 [Mycena galopus ATCC 62051]